MSLKGKVTGVLETLQDTAILVLFPYAWDTRTVIANIITAVGSINDNKRAFQHLRQDVCEVASILASTLQRAAAGGCTKECAKNVGLNEQLQTLINTLNEILQFAQKRSLLFRVRRVIVTFRSDGSRIQEYRERLKYTLEWFKLQSTMVPCATCHRERTHEIVNTAIPQMKAVIGEQLRSTSHVHTAPENASPEETASQPQRSPQSNTYGASVVNYFNNNGDVHYYGNPGGMSRYHQ
ncbi:hypothetical protein K435DRAFT_964210 [Dendrothele bispora CBS 962.96]|uniref:Fungal N-terminal domain-containing protein n=1 Tax=Dendrothele bispora (strain CBS 962.96) TaxID=1314807 RepID=A0A4V4HGT9_DENBC|nr:hypothetical protein K435DRAFT_964210 [Dendrothele bispora CBS 962.96]